MSAPTITETALRQHLEVWLSSARRQARTLLVRARPTWSGAPVIVVRDTSVRVVEGISGLAALDAMRTASSDEVVVVLTALTERELGAAVVLDAHRHEVRELNEWSLVPALFGVRDQVVPRDVRDLGAWVPGLLTRLRPDRGYQPAPGAVLTAGHIVRSLLVGLLRLGRLDDLDLATSLTPLDDDGVRAQLRELPVSTRDGIVRATAAQVGHDFALALRVAAGGGHVSVIAVGLVAGELWSTGAIAPDAETAAARVRIEPYIGTNPPALMVARFGAAARRLTQRLLTDVHGKNLLEQAEALCVELGWAEGAEASDFLPTGLRARVRLFASAIEAAVALPGSVEVTDVERTFAAITEHRAVTMFAQSAPTATMAVRLVRWLNEARSAPANFSEAVEQYVADGGWAERALGDIWDGDHTAELARAYSELAHAVQTVRREQDRAAAALLTGARHTDEAVPAIENLLTQVVVPLSSRHRVLLVVLDGMSAATATELAAELPERGWSELVRTKNLRRGAAIAALPTITEYSRTSLFAGELLTGNQQTEKSRFAGNVGGVVFHKDDLRADAGHALPPAVTDAIADSARKIVGVVINTIDDALATAEVDALRWHIPQIANLSALLAAAQDAGRLVILTSDHGHMVERGSELRSIPGAAARFRDQGSVPLQADEVLVSGPRVLSPGGTAVLAVSDGVRYGAKRAGYHGGASLAEVTIPIVVVKPNGAENPTGWVEAPPQEPLWWNESAASDEAVPTAELPTAKPRPRKAASAAPTLFDDVPETTDAPGDVAPELDAQLIASDIYRDRRSLGGRHPIDDDTLRVIIRTLVAGGGRAHRDTIAAAAGVAVTSLAGVVASLRRLLNIDGYVVVGVDADQVTIMLDESLLREQFGLGARP